MKLTEAEVDEMIASVDSDGDGMINFHELVKLFTGTMWSISSEIKFIWSYEKQSKFLWAAQTYVDGPVSI